MKILKVLLGILLFLVLAVVILGLIGPKGMDVSVKENINAPQSFVWNYIKDFKGANSWSPWSEKDPNMKNEYIGTDGTVGAKYTWSGNKDVGTGEQEIMKIVPGERIETKLFFADFGSYANNFMALNPSGEGTEIEWGFDSKNGFMERVMFNFMDVEGAVTKDFKHGLNTLKKMAEKDWAAAQQKAAQAAQAAEATVE